MKKNKQQSSLKHNSNLKNVKFLNEKTFEDGETMTKENKINATPTELKAVSETKPFVYGNHFPPLSFNNVKEIVRQSWIKKSRMRLVCMKNRAGNYELFTINAVNETFEYRGAEYIIHTEDEPTELSSGFQISFYHQDISSPIKIDVPIQALQQHQVLNDGLSVQNKTYNIEYAINPYLIKRFMLSTIIEKTMQGEDMQKQFSLLKILGIIGVVIGAITLIVILQFTGYLNNLPFM